MDSLKQQIEAVLFVTDEPVSIQKLKDILPGTKASELQEAVTGLRAEYENSERAFTIEEIGGGFRMLTRPQYADIIARLKKAKAEKKLSSAALETLAIVAYKQPIKRVDIESIRGVQCGEVLRALMERGLVRITGRDTVPGAPVLYGTTKEFLEVFGLKSVDDLPKPEEVK